MKALLRKLRLKRVWIPLSLIVLFLTYAIFVNRHSLCEGLSYLIDGIFYEPVSNYPVRSNGPFRLAHKLVSLSSLERMKAIKRTLSENGIDFQAIPVAEGYENIFVPGKLSKGFLLIEAHYDKRVDDMAFHAATDNTGSVVVLLAVIRELKDELPRRPVAFLFTALEERGLVGAFHFIEYARQRGYRVEGALCLDMVGRGRPVIATSANAAGFCFHIPFYRSMLYNGREFSDVPDLWPIDRSMLNTYLPKTRTYKAFVSCTDASAFLRMEIPALHLEGDNMWHADQVWGRNTDTIDRLDERALLECKSLIEQLVRKLR